jgi:biopolymer transport protein ExbB
MNRLALILLAALAGQSLAQESAPTAAAEPAPRVSIEDAYKKEFALLEAQKRELSARVAEVQRNLQNERARLERELATLESRALTARSEAEALSDELVRVEQRSAVAAGNRELVAATIEQARISLGQLGDNRLDSDEFAASSDADKLQAVFGYAGETLAQLSRIRRETGSFFLADGSEVQGTIVRLGNVAAFGVSPQGAGALAPAGGGRLRLWSQPAAESANALAQGRMPAVLGLFLYENPNAAVSEPEAKSVAGEVRKGGLIGYIIVLLGALALVLVVLRAIFLKRAGAAIAPILDGVEGPLRAQRVDDAIAACKRHKGSAARVVTATLRNLDRDREHLEDIVSESILHESTHLSRFGAVITVIAAVAPLLGLLGTVTGMIQTFDVITEFGTSDPKLLSGGIAVALVTTQLGLAVAIPLLLLGSLLNGWAERIKDDMEKAALKVINLAGEVKHRARAQAA